MKIPQAISFVKDYCTNPRYSKIFNFFIKRYEKKYNEN